MGADTLTLSYLAGFFDGEGSIGFYSRSPRITVVNTYLPILKQFKTIFGGSIIKRQKVEEHHKYSYAWVLCGNKIDTVLTTLLPYLKEKRKQALIIFDIIDSKKEKKKVLIRKLSELKR